MYFKNDSFINLEAIAYKTNGDVIFDFFCECSLFTKKTVCDKIKIIKKVVEVCQRIINRYLV